MYFDFFQEIETNGENIPIKRAKALHENYQVSS